MWENNLIYLQAQKVFLHMYPSLGSYLRIFLWQNELTNKLKLVDTIKICEKSSQDINYAEKPTSSIEAKDGAFQEKGVNKTETVIENFKKAYWHDQGQQ